MAIPIRRHLFLPRRPASERTGRLLLVALAADRPDGHPDNVAATARQVGVAECTVRRWRRDLLDEGLLARTAAGFLVRGPGLPAFEAAAAIEFASRGLRWSWDPLPRRLLGRYDAAVLWAVAVVYGDGVGPKGQNPRRYVRADRERAALVNVSRPTIRAARAVIQAHGLAHIEELRRGRANLIRARWKDETKGNHGAPMAPEKAARLAAAAAVARSRPVPGFPPANEEPGTRSPVASDIRASVASHHQIPSGSNTHRGDARPAPTGDGRSRSKEADGRQKLEAQKRRAETAAFLEPAKVRRWFADSQKRTPRQACTQLLELAGFADTAPRLRIKWAALIADSHREDAPELLAALIADVAKAGGKSRAKSIGAVLAKRLPRLVAGKGLDALSERNRTKTPAEVLGLPAAVRDPVAPRPRVQTTTRTVGDYLQPFAAPTFAEMLKQQGLGRLVGGA